MKLLTLSIPISALVLTSCMVSGVKPIPLKPITVKNKVIETIGYSSKSNYKRYPQSQQKLLAIRGAKLDAYRNLAEEVYGIKIKGKSSVKDLIVENDSYRTYVNTLIRGAHIESISEKKDGLFEAEVTMTLTPRYTACLLNPTVSCLNSANQYQAEVVDNQVISGTTSQTTGIYAAPGYGYYNSSPYYSTTPEVNVNVYPY